MIADDYSAIRQQLQQLVAQRAQALPVAVTLRINDVSVSAVVPRGIADKLVDYARSRSFIREGRRPDWIG